MAALEGIHAAYMAQQGDIALLLARLRNSNLTTDEKEFIEARLTGVGGKSKRGRRPLAETARRNQTIIMANAWLKYVKGIRKDEARLCNLSAATGLSASQLRSIIKSQKTVISIFTIDEYKKIGLLVRAGIIDIEKVARPTILID